MASLRLGSLVMLRSGSPEMTVVEYVSSDYNGNTLLKCAMFNINRQVFETITVALEAVVSTEKAA